jgi:pilus assembly protein Flp/PilA
MLGHLSRRAQSAGIITDGDEPVKIFVTRFLKDESGATAIEYGLIAAGISVAIITVVKGVGTKLTAAFTTIKTGLG